MTECVCVRERERERDRKRDRKRDREREEKRTGASGRERGKYVERKRAGDSTHVLARERVCVCTHVCVFCVCETHVSAEVGEVVYVWVLTPLHEKVFPCCCCDLQISSDVGISCVCSCV